jgi:putative membrane protein
MNKDLILREKLALQRTILANQSTFLAFLRTSMYFLIAGISINNLTNVKYDNIIELIFISVSILLLAVGIINYYRQKVKILDSEKHVGDYKDEYNTTKT